MKERSRRIRRPAASLLALLLLLLGTVACQGSDSSTDTEAPAASDTVAATSMSDESTSEPSAPTDTAEAATRPAEPATDAVYPDGEQNPDWPYSPGV